MYKYEENKKYIFSDEGQRLFIAVRDRVLSIVEESGAITMAKASRLPAKVGAADSFNLMACVDRMVELGDLSEVWYRKCTTQERVFIKVRS